jgi:hypothetical protein
MVKAHGQPGRPKARWRQQPGKPATTILFIMQKLVGILFIIAIPCAVPAQPGIANKPVHANIITPASNEADIVWAGLSAQLDELAAGRASSGANSAAPLPVTASGMMGDASGAMLASAPDKRTSAPVSKGTGYGRAVMFAREFMQKFPGDPRAAKAKKIELASLLRRQRADGTKPHPMEDAEIDHYIKNPALSAADRYDISALAKETRADRSKIRNADDSRKLHAGHARELIQEFPEDARGYGYLLAAAKSLPAELATKAAGEILSSNAPDRIKQGAGSLLAQKNMEGRKLQIEGLDIDAHGDHPVIIYTWSKQRPDILQFVKRHCVFPGLRLIGINIDADTEEAREFAKVIRLPGDQYYDGGRLDGPLVSQLRVQTTMSVYILDGEGRLVDTRGHLGTLEKLRRLTGMPGKSADEEERP